MQNSIVHEELRFSQFKTIYCNENHIISSLLNSLDDEHIVGPFMDVGSGLGDIAYTALPHLQGYLIDISKPDKTQARETHKIVEADFLKLCPSNFPKINTLIFCHSLQYLDDEVAKLTDKIIEFDPLIVIDVVNQNVGKFEDVCRILQERLNQCNKETPIFYLPNCYKQIKNIPFNACLKCDSFRDLIHIMCHFILDSPKAPEELSELIVDVKDLIEQPTLDIAQMIRIYKKVDNIDEQ